MGRTLFNVACSTAHILCFTREYVEKRGGEGGEERRGEERRGEERGEEKREDEERGEEKREDGKGNKNI